MEETGRKIICGAQTTLAVKGLMMMMMMKQGSVRQTIRGVQFLLSVSKLTNIETLETYKTRRTVGVG